MLSFIVSLLGSKRINILGLEQCKAREGDASKEEANEENIGSKDLLIKRKVPVIVGQAISVVGGYTEKVPTIETPTTVKRLPEPILPSAQNK